MWLDKGELDKVRKRSGAERDRLNLIEGFLDGFDLIDLVFDLLTLN